MLLAQGARVIATDVDAAGLERLRSAGAEVVLADMASQDGREEFVRGVGACDHLVIAQGILRTRPIEDITAEDWDDVMSVNAKSPYFLCRRFGEILGAGGSIVTISSVSARVASVLEQSIYSASEAALSSITRTFAHLYAPRGIRVNTVLPGIIETQMQDQFREAMARARHTTPDSIEEERLRHVPLGRTAPPEAIARTITWLMSPSASYIT